MGILRGISIYLIWVESSLIIKTKGALSPAVIYSEISIEDFKQSQFKSCLSRQSNALYTWNIFTMKSTLKTTSLFTVCTRYLFTNSVYIIDQRKCNTLLLGN